MEEITVLLRDLAAQLGVTVEYLWPFLVKQTVISWYSWMLGGVFALLTGVVSFKIAIPLTKDYETEGWGIALGIAGGFALVTGFILVTCTLCSLDCLFAPEAVTFKNLLGSIGG